jgi:putative adhesin
MALSTPRLVLLVFGVLLVVCGVSVGVSEAFKHDRTTTTTINRHIERVVVRAGTGKVHLEGTESQRVMVREQLQWLWRKPIVHTSLRGATLTVSGACPDTGPVNRCKADLDLAIPFDADVVVQGDSGDISAERLAGHLKLTTDSGDVTARDLNAISISATTNAGDVDVAFTTQPVSVSANSNSGDVLVTVPSGGEYRVDATTAAGDVHVEGVLRNDRALRSISATADAGDVTVRGRQPS